MKKFAMIAGLLLALGLSTALFGCDQSSELAYVSLDINPSIDMVLDARDRVQTVTAMNADGEVLLYNLALENMKLEDAIDTVIDEAIDLGFIDPDAEGTTVTVDGSSEQVRSRLHTHVNNAFQNKGIMGSAVAKENTDLIEEAATLEVTVGFLRLVYRALEANDELLKEDALLMTQQELIQIIKDKNGEMKMVATELKTEFFTARQELFDLYLPQIQALEAEIAELAELGEPTEEKEAELEALKVEFHEALAALRTEYQADGEALRQQIQIRKQDRIQEHREEVEAYRAEIRQRRQQMQDDIASFQEQHTTAESTDSTQNQSGRP